MDDELRGSLNAVRNLLACHAALFSDLGMHRSSDIAHTAAAKMDKILKTDDSTETPAEADPNDL